MQQQQQRLSDKISVPCRGLSREQPLATRIPHHHHPGHHLVVVLRDPSGHWPVQAENRKIPNSQLFAMGIFRNQLDPILAVHSARNSNSSALCISTAQPAIFPEFPVAALCRPVCKWYSIFRLRIFTVRPTNLATTKQLVTAVPRLCSARSFARGRVD